MTIKEYRKQRGLTQAELAAEISKDIPGIDRALISRMETGLCLPSQVIVNWLDKACAHGVGERKGLAWTTLREAEKKALKTELQAQIYEALEKASSDSPVTRRMLMIRTGRSDRQVRNAISEMRQDGILIVASSRGYGYWLAQTDHDVRLLRREYSSRLKSCRKILHVIDTVSPDQILMEVDCG